ncbi:MAG: hypothetical protein U1C74_27660 [Phenylobacterium sp.]|nr:hypothetical protein [Phenylobacterium sp.]
MKTLIVTLAAAAALTAGTAAAQPHGYGPRDRWTPIEARFEQLDWRIDRGVRAGQLTRREAYRLRSEFREIARLEYRYGRGGLSYRERADLDRRFDRLAAQIRWERTDRDRRYGWNRY